MRLDRTDFDILDTLQKNAELTNKELAELVDLAPSSCLLRVRRLRRAGILKGSHAEVDPAALGITLEALVSVRFSRHNEAQLNAFRDALLKRPEVVALYHVSGAIDFIAHVAVKDVAQLRDLGAEAFTNHKLVSHIETSLIFEHFRAAALPGYATPARPR